MICKNCEYKFDGKFCNNCGQNSNVRNVDFKYIIDEIPNSVFQVNRGILFTIKELLARPGHSIRDFLSGKRKQHFKPLAFILLLSAIYVLITYFTGKNTYLGNVFSGMTKASNDSEIKLTITSNLLKWLSNNFGYSTLLLLPIFSFASYISFLKAKYNFFEHLILNIYLAGQQILIYLTFEIVFFVINIEGSFVQIVPFIIGTLYLFWTFIQFFNKEKKYLNILRIILTYILYFILIMVIIYLLGFIEGKLNTTANTL